jgi:predicted ferric reductase
MKALTDLPLKYSRGSRFALAAAFFVLMYGLALALAAIPVVKAYQAYAQYEYMPPWTETVGKACALAALGLILWQFILGVRVHFLDKIFSLNRLYVIHRYNAIAAGVLLVCHPLLVFWTKGPVGVGPLEFDFYLVLGGVLLVALWATIAFAVYRVLAGMPYRLWYKLHENGVNVLAVLALAHALAMGSDLQTGWARWTLVGVFALFAFVFLRLKKLRPKMGAVVSAVEPAGKDAYAVALGAKSEGAPLFDHLPGQFLLFKPKSIALPKERHPFTISSAPGGGTHVLTIRCSGDWTQDIGRLAPGEEAVIEGPYGHFSHTILAPRPETPLVMVAGGVGVTPMLSMLRALAAEGSTREVRLVWSNRTMDDVVYPEELEKLSGKLPNFRLTHVLTRQPDYEGETGRLDAERLGRLLADMDLRKAHAFVCGPPAMMQSVATSLRRVGVSRRRIHMEEFAL